MFLFLLLVRVTFINCGIFGHYRMDYNNQGDSSDGKVAKWNSMGFIFNRMNNLWTDAHNHCRTGKYEKWNLDLDRIWMEIVDDAEEEDEKKFDELNKEVEKIGFMRLVNGSTGDQFYKNKPKLYKVICKKEVFLRRMQKKQGKGIGYDEGEDEYMDT